MSETGPSGRMVPIEWLQGAFAMRAAAYANMFDVLREAFGTDRAVEIVSEATRRMGVTMGAKFADLGPADLNGLKDRFLGGIPAGEVIFQPEVLRCDDERLEIQFHRCPLKEAWQEAGYDGAALANLCDIGGVVDYGTFEKAGFRIQSDTWQPGREGCCRLHIRPGPG